jgi:hypothetical protein
MNYKFDNINGGLDINNPEIALDSYTCNMDGTCIVSMKLSISNSEAQSTSFRVDLFGYSYTGDLVFTDMETWALLEIDKYQV